MKFVIEENIDDEYIWSLHWDSDGLIAVSYYAWETYEECMDEVLLVRDKLCNIPKHFEGMGLPEIIYNGNPI